MWRNLSAVASASSFEPGSVIAMKRLPAFSEPMVSLTLSKKYCLKMFGSSVDPDLLETMKRVLARSIFFSKALTWAGSVESSTLSFGKPSIWPKVFARTSGHRLEPPIPSNKMSLNFSLRISCASCWNFSLHSDCFSATSSQPSHCDSSPLVHRDASRCHNCRTLPAARQSFTFCATCFASASGSLELCRLIFGVVSPCVLFSTAASSLSNASSNRRTPSTVSLSVMRSIEMPVCARFCITSLASSTRSVRVSRGFP